MVTIDMMWRYNEYDGGETTMTYQYDGDGTMAMI